MLDVAVSHRFILQSEKSRQYIVIEHFIIRGCQCSQICLVHYVTEHMYRHFHSFSFHSRVSVIEMLEHIWQYELQSHVN